MRVCLLFSTDAPHQGCHCWRCYLHGHWSLREGLRCRPRELLYYASGDASNCRRLKLAWSLGIRRIRVHSNSMTGIAIFAKDSELDHQHVYRETNNIANYLTNLGHSFTYDMHIFLLTRSGSISLVTL
ncbi:hypothetical protein LINGRAHAP2_LOCUS5671 [Linum grandiflorum]